MFRLGVQNEVLFFSEWIIWICLYAAGKVFLFILPSQNYIISALLCCRIFTPTAAGKQPRKPVKTSLPRAKRVEEIQPNKNQLRMLWKSPTQILHRKHAKTWKWLVLVLSTDFWYQPSWCKTLCFPLLVLHSRRYLTWRDDKHLEPKYKAEYERNECKIYVSADPGNSEVPCEVRSPVWPGARKWSGFKLRGEKKGGGRGWGAGGVPFISFQTEFHFIIL